jgi:hypothetical protein
MSRGSTLTTLVSQLQSEARLSTNTSRGIDKREELKALLARTQEVLYDEHPWPFLRAQKETARKTLAAGQRYYDFPSGVNEDRLLKVWNQYGTGIWTELRQGISPEEYTAFDSDQDQRADPVLRWDWYGTNQFEVWPIPASEGGSIWFDALVPLDPLVEESDQAVLDDRLIVLFAAAEVLAASGQKDAPAKLAMAQKRLRALLGNTSSKNRITLNGSNNRIERTGRVVLRVVYAG